MRTSGKVEESRQEYLNNIRNAGNELILNMIQQGRLLHHPTYGRKPHDVFTIEAFHFRSRNRHNKPSQKLPSLKDG